MPDERLARIIAQFDSDQAGIRAAAFNRADALIEEAGLRWTDVLTEIFAVVEKQPMRLSGVEFGHVDLCRDILRNDIDYLNRWERSFVQVICEKMFLSTKEAARLNQIATNIPFRRDVRAEFSD